MTRVDAPLIDPDDLAARLRTSPPPVILDVRWSLAGGADRAAYDGGHIPAAVFVDFDRDVCGPPGAGRHPLPEPGALQDALRRAGIDEGDDVIVVDSGDLLAAARTWWTLRWAGIESVRVLDGGMALWVGPTETTAETPAPGSFEVRPGDRQPIDADEAKGRARVGALVDVRSSERYRGESEPIDAVAGHIPGARNVADPVIVDGRMAEPEQIRSLLPIGTGPVAAYCGSGVTAARMVLAGASAGIDVDLYVGSWSEWITDAERPIATGDEGRPEPIFRHLDDDDVPWQKVKAQRNADGSESAVWEKWLAFSTDPLYLSLYARYDPGMIVRRHGHMSPHVVFVLDGSVRIGDRDCPAGTHVELPAGAAFGPIVAGSDGAVMFEVMTGDPRSWGDDPARFEAALEAAGATPLPDPPLEFPPWLADLRAHWATP